MQTSLSWLGRLVSAPTGVEWEQLVTVYTPLLQSWSRRAGVPDSDCDDLVQDVLVVVVRRVADFEHQHAGAFRGWLRAILANRLRTYFRDNAKHVCLISLEDVCDSASALSHLFDREHDEYLARRAIKIAEHDFSPITWTAFREQVLNNRSAQDVATELNRSLNSVIKAKSRVLHRIRQELERLV